MTPASARIELIVGLGNPGTQYQRTRHNAGFWFVDALARQFAVGFNKDKRTLSEIAKYRYQDREIILLKPQNFMNNSGAAVAGLARYFKIPSTSILVVYDEIDLPVGTLRLKADGGHGGHNGMRDIISQLGSKEFWRLRIGVGHPGDKSQVVDYVLKQAAKAEQDLIDAAVHLALTQTETILNGEMERAMHVLHSA